MNKTKHIIRNAYDAYHFLYDHPKFMVQERTEVKPREAKSLEKRGYLITRDPSGKCYRVWRHLWRHAMDHNLDIFYAKTDKPGGRGRVNDDRSKNQHVECWLEFGRMYYGFVYSGGEEPLGEWDTETMLHQAHDPFLDTGAPTFDEALVKLAKLVRKHYGDYTNNPRKKDCGKPICGDCERWKEVDKVICDCHTKEKQVCDLCQGVGGKDKI